MKFKKSIKWELVKYGFLEYVNVIARSIIALLKLIIN